MYFKFKSVTLFIFKLKFFSCKSLTMITMEIIKNKSNFKSFELNKSIFLNFCMQKNLIFIFLNYKNF